jgi:modulator of FtsH protease
MAIYPLSQWSAFFGAEVGASATLAGFVIVAISINISRILSHPVLPGRAAETLVAPTGVLIASSYGLVPSDGPASLGIELLCVGIVMWLIPAIIQWRTARLPDHPKRALIRRIALAQASSLPVIASGALTLAHDPDALYWLVPGITFSLIATVINAWVLLVEILR